MKKLIRSLILGLIGASTFSCSSNVNNPHLNFSVTPSQTTLITAAASSCVDLATAQTSQTAPSQSISAAYVTFRNPTMSWSGDGNFYLNEITFDASDQSVGSTPLSLNADPNELACIFIGANATSAQLVILGGNSQGNSFARTDGNTAPIASIIFGGITLAAGVNAAAFFGLLKVNGVEVKSDATNNIFYQQQVEVIYKVN